MVIVSRNIFKDQNSAIQWRGKHALCIYLPPCKLATYGGYRVSWESPLLTDVLPCKPGKALSLWSEAVLEDSALWYLTCHESEL